jgi:Escherichia/Staphylococcus phage prohead protease
MNSEQRFFNEPDYKAELRFEERGEKKQKVIHGYPAKFNKKSLNLGGYRENILPGTFARSLRNKNDVRALLNHDPSLMLGRTTAGTCSLSEDRTGLLMECEPADTSVARDVIQWIQRDEINQGSFRFRVLEDNWRVEDGDPVRDLMDVDLSDVSVVTYPAYEDTSALVRSAGGISGVDFTRVAGILVRLQHKLEIPKTEHDALREAIEKLTRAQSSMNETTNFSVLDSARRRLMLAEREF